MVLCSNLCFRNAFIISSAVNCIPVQIVLQFVTVFIFLVIGWIFQQVKKRIIIKNSHNCGQHGNMCMCVKVIDIDIADENDEKNNQFNW